MQYCRKCKVSVNGNKKCCPLCQHKLSGEPEPECYPNIPLPKYSHRFVIKLLTFIAIAASVISYAVNILIDPSFMWSVIVCLGALCAWIAAVVAIVLRKRVVKIIMWELLLFAPICVAWDYNTGWYLWSLNFVLPCMCCAAIVSTVVITCVMRYPPQEYIFYLIVEIFYGIIPFVLVMKGLVTIALPSMICSVLSFLSILLLMLFMRKNTESEVRKRFHL